MISRYTTTIIRMMEPTDKAPTDRNHEHPSITQRMDMGITASMVAEEKNTTRTGAQSRQIMRRKKMICGERGCTHSQACFSLAFRHIWWSLWSFSLGSGWARGLVSQFSRRSSVVRSIASGGLAMFYMDHCPWLGALTMSSAVPEGIGLLICTIDLAVCQKQVGNEG